MRTYGVSKTAAQHGISPTQKYNRVHSIEEYIDTINHQLVLYFGALKLSVPRIFPSSLDASGKLNTPWEKLG